MTRPRPNLTRIIRAFIEMYWGETECLKVLNGKETARCADLHQSREAPLIEAKMCDVCLGLHFALKARYHALELKDERNNPTKPPQQSN